ncbi:MAG: hypothetical protein U0168_22620 [Nannocystaceae bacterium]
MLQLLGQRQLGGVATACARDAVGPRDRGREHVRDLEQLGWREREASAGAQQQRLQRHRAQGAGARARAAVERGAALITDRVVELAAFGGDTARGPRAAAAEAAARCSRPRPTLGSWDVLGIVVRLLLARLRDDAERMRGRTSRRAKGRQRGPFEMDGIGNSPAGPDTGPAFGLRVQPFTRRVTSPTTTLSPSALRCVAFVHAPRLSTKASAAGS